MKFSEMQQAVADAKAELSRADCFVAQMAEIIAGRLRTGRVPQGVLRELKRELRDYNPHTGVWKK